MTLTNNVAEEQPYRLAEMEGLLQEARMDYSRIGTHLRTELHALGGFYGVAYFVAAEEVFALRGDRGEQVYARSQLWEQVCGKDHFGHTPKKNLYVFVVGPADVIDDPEYSRARMHEVNDDRNYALKRVVTPGQALWWLKNPFLVLEGAARAAARPRLQLIPEMHEQALASLQEAEPERLVQATHVLSYGCAEGRCDNPTIASRGSPEFWEHVGQLFKRVMGVDYLLLVSEETLSVSHRLNPRGAPLWQASRGERMAFAVAYTLAESAADARPGLCLGVYDVVSAFDTIRQLVVLDLLRDFAVATGATIQLKSVKSDIKRFAKSKFELLEPAAAA